MYVWRRGGELSARAGEEDIRREREKERERARARESHRERESTRESRPPVDTHLLDLLKLLAVLIALQLDVHKLRLELLDLTLLRFEVLG